jgi:hypothetical protein
VATRASDVLGWIREARVAVEAPSRSQADEDLAWAPLEPSLDLDRVVARVEDEQGDDPFFKPAQQSLDLFGCHHVGVLGGPDTLYVHGGGPALAGEAELCDPLVGPAGDDGLTGRVSGGMVVEAALRAALRVAAIPHAHINGVDGRLPFGASDRMVGEEFP